MNLFIVCGNLKAGGAERVVSILANKFQSLGHRISVITWYETDVFYKFNPISGYCRYRWLRVREVLLDR